jgi:hypothetical protein
MRKGPDEGDAKAFSALRPIARRRGDLMIEVVRQRYSMAPAQIDLVKKSFDALWPFRRRLAEQFYGINVTAHPTAEWIAQNGQSLWHHFYAMIAVPAIYLLSRQTSTLLYRGMNSLVSRARVTPLLQISLFAVRATGGLARRAKFSSGELAQVDIRGVVRPPLTKRTKGSTDDREQPRCDRNQARSPDR